jgi:tryptophan synthase alpha chain
VAAVETALGQARAAGRPSLVAYVTGGIREDWTDLLTAMIEAGADAVEIGLPFSDPMLDGYTIQQASAAAISRGATIASILAQLAEAKAVVGSRVPLIAMTYANHAYSRGLPAFCRQLADAGLSGVIIPDLPAAEADDYLEAADRAGLDATLMVTPATEPEQIKAIAGQTRGFLYVMSVMATTGTSRESDDTERWAVAARARSAIRGLASPDSTAGVCQPSAIRGLASPDSPAGVCQPSAIRGLASPDRPAGVCQPSAIRGLASPDSPAGVCQPSAIRGLASPDRPAGVCQPSAIRGLASPDSPADVCQPNSPRPNSPRPVLIGFGIDTPARAAAAARHADGVIVASALMRRVLDGASSADIGRDVTALRAALDQVSR